MRQQLVMAAVGVALAFALAVAVAAPVPVAHDCQSAPGDPKYVKPSSLTPGERAYRNQYGSPISKPIFARHAARKPKAQPQLHTSPLPGA